MGVPVAGALAYASMYTVDGGESVVIFDRVRGVRPTAVGEGTHFLVPLLQRAVFFDTRIRPRTITTTTGTRDMQTVSLTLRVLHRPDADALPAIFSRLGPDYDERMLPSIANEVLKSAVAQFDAHELVTQREAVSARVRTELTSRAADFSLCLEDVSLTHVLFGAEFTRAVEAKQVAQQDAERARFVVERSEHERDAAVVRATGEAEAARAIAEAIDEAGAGFVELRRIEAAKDIAAALCRAKNVSFAPAAADSRVVFPLSVQ